MKAKDLRPFFFEMFPSEQTETAVQHQNIHPLRWDAEANHAAADDSERSLRKGERRSQLEGNGCIQGLWLAVLSPYFFRRFYFFLWGLGRLTAQANPTASKKA